MIRLCRVELFKLRTMRVTFGLWATVVVLTGVFAALEASRAGNGRSGVAPLSTAAGVSTVTTLTGWSMLFAAVLGVIAVSTEYRHSSVTLTYLATPDRRRVLMAKACSAAVVGALYGLVAGLVSTGVGLAFVAARHDHLAISAGAIVGHVAGAMLGAALFALIGVGIGSLLRSQVAGIIVVFMWGLVIESIIGGLFTSVRPYLPYTAATTLAGIRLGGAAFGPAHGVNGGQPLPFVAGAALVAGVGGLLAVVAARTSLARDVT